MLDTTELKRLTAAKKALRQEMLQKRKALTAAQLADLSRLAQEHILNSRLWAGSKQILLYCSINNEVSTDLLLQNALASQKTLLLPRCASGKENRLELAVCSNFAELKPGKFGIAEPDPLLCKAPCSQELAPNLIVLPALAFDAKGNRLGYGAGYYDRFLAELFSAQNAVRPRQSGPPCPPYLLGMAFAWQVLPAVPTSVLDKKVDAICTEQGFIFCNPQAEEKILCP